MFGLWGGRRIILRPDSKGEVEVKIKGEIPVASHAAIREFFLELGVMRGKVSLRMTGNGAMSVRFSMDFPKELQQRVRNFIHSLNL